MLPEETHLCNRGDRDLDSRCPGHVVRDRESLLLVRLRGRTWGRHALIGADRMAEKQRDLQERGSDGWNK